MAEPAACACVISNLAFRLFGLTSTAKRAALGNSSCNNPNRLAETSICMLAMPVALPSGRLRLATRPTGARQAQAVRKADGRMRKHHQVREGQIVRVIEGPFTGFQGEVKEVDEQTAKVAVQVFGRITPVDLALRQIIAAKKFKQKNFPKR